MQQKMPNHLIISKQNKNLTPPSLRIPLCLGEATNIEGLYLKDKLYFKDSPGKF